MVVVEVIIFIFGSMFGSAANALIDRLPREESWFAGRSHCDHCRHVLEWYDLVPIVSYLSLGGKCRYCRSPIPFRNTGVEIFLGMGFVTVFRLYGLTVGQLFLSGILWASTIVAVMDWETKLVSEPMVLVWAGLVLGYQFMAIGLVGWQSLLAGLVAGVGLIGGLWLVTRGKAMGFGDVEIAAVAGWWLGWPAIAAGLWVAFVTGAVVGGLGLLTGKRGMKSEIAFGPFLVLGSWCGFLFGRTLLGWLLPF